MTAIYIDVLIGLNLYVTYFLLLATETLCGYKATGWRRGVSALLGGLSSLMLLLPELPFWGLWGVKLGLAAVLVFMAFGYRSFQLFFKRVLLFFAVNFMFAGVMLALWVILMPQKLTIRNGTVYYHLSALTLILSTIVAYGAVRLIERFHQTGKAKGKTAAALVGVEGRETMLTVFCDTGNKARSLGGSPVVVCKSNALTDILPPDIAPFLLDIHRLSELQSGKWSKRLSVVPCTTLGGEQLLPAFRPDFFRWEGERESRPCVIAITDHPLLQGEADAIAGECLFT